MKVLTLEMEGFGPYLARQKIDFTAFDDDIFVITGKTGAGKSTILDAIVFALYDSVPRYDGGESSVRSHFCGDDDPSSVTLEFESGARRYKVTRSPEYQRPKKRGDGLTTQKAQATLWIDNDGQWDALEVQLRDVNRRIGEIMQLTATQFLQVILLAQGRFQEFLDANTNDRLKVLRSLFGTGRFEQVEKHVRDAAKERSREVESADVGLSDIVARAMAEAGTVTEVAEPSLTERDAWLRATAAALQEQAAEATGAREKSVTAAAASADAFSKAKSLVESHARLAAARVTVAELEARAERHAADAARLAGAQQAKPVGSPLRAVEARQAHVESASDARGVAIDEAHAAAVTSVAWPESLGELTEATEEDLAARVIELEGEISGISHAVTQELQLHGMREKAAAAIEAVTAAEAARDAVRTSLEDLPAREKELRQARDVASEQAARVNDLESALERAQASHKAHARSAILGKQVEAAQKAEAAASQTHADAVAAHNALVQRRLRSQAAHLAQELVDGEPCAVCGAVEHPSPAKPTDAHVTDDEVDAAGVVVDGARKELAAASAAVRDVEKQLAAARELAGDGDGESAAAAQNEAAVALESAKDALAERGRLEKEIAGLEAQAQALKESLALKVTALEQAQTARTTTAKDVVDTEAAVVKARADYESVGARARDLERAQTLVRDIAVATTDVAKAQRSLTEAREALTAALKESGFTDAAAAREAMLPDAELVELNAAVTAYTEKLAGARAVVKNLAEQDLPPVPDDLPALEEAAKASATARDAAVAAATASAGLVERFSRLVEEYRTRASASLEARQARDVALTLADSLEGHPPNERKMRLESFVLASKLERIVAAANVRLEAMSAGQYRLEHDDDKQYRNAQTGLGLRIADAHTGQSRTTKSLSGGETFLASLALALGLAETVTAEAGGIRLSTLFIDEGFGSLDGDTLEMAMSTLDELRSGGRTIGLISHVEAMKEQIPRKLDVVKAADGSSRVVVAGDALE